jgi:hypothetical protein
VRPRDFHALTRIGLGRRPYRVDEIVTDAVLISTRTLVKKWAKNWFAALPLLVRLLWVLAGIELILLVGRAIA